MIQRFIEIGEGYGDIYELRELMLTNRSRFMHGFVFTTKDMAGTPALSIAVAFKPAEQGNFMPLYICREGIPENSKRLQLFEETVKELGGLPIYMDVKHSAVYANRQFYFSHLISVLRLNHYIPPMQ